MVLVLWLGALSDLSMAYSDIEDLRHGGWRCGCGGRVSTCRVLSNVRG